MYRFYVLPMVVIDGSRQPKYINLNPDENPNAWLEIAKWGAMDYGLVDVAILAADVDATQQTFLEAQSDVLSVAEDLDTMLPPGAVPTIQAFFEDKLIPADWINASYTYRSGLRVIGGLFQFAQRFNGLYQQPLLMTQAELNDRPNQWAAGYETALIATAQSFGYLTDWGGNWQLRLVLKYLADQWGDDPLIIAGQYI